MRRPSLKLKPNYLRKQKLEYNKIQNQKNKKKNPFKSLKMLMKAKMNPNLRSKIKKTKMSKKSRK
jgi:hypothetical protein